MSATVIAYVRLSQSLPDGGPQIVIAQVGQVRIFLAGGATPVLLCGVAHRLDRA
jgi:hypothetical protein